MPSVDYVAGVPDSGVPHAIGFANRSGKPFARPFVKYTPTWPRSFMPASQKVREQVVEGHAAALGVLPDEHRKAAQPVPGGHNALRGEYEDGGRAVDGLPACPSSPSPAPSWATTARTSLAPARSYASPPRAGRHWPSPGDPSRTWCGRGCFRWSGSAAESRPAHRRGSCRPGVCPGGSGSPPRKRCQGWRPPSRTTRRAIPW